MATARKAAGTTKKAGALTTKVNDHRAKFADIPEATRDALIKEIMDYPEGCHEGKIAFLRSIGWPVPAENFRLWVVVDLEVPGTEIEDEYGTLSDAILLKVGSTVATALAEFSPTRVTVDDFEQR